MSSEGDSEENSSSSKNSKDSSEEENSESVTVKEDSEELSQSMVHLENGDKKDTSLNSAVDFKKNTVLAGGDAVIDEEMGLG